MGDGPRRLEYETAEVGRRPVVRVATVAVGAAAAFVGSAVWVLAPDLHNHLEPVVLGPWVVLGATSGVMMFRVRKRVRAGRWQEARAGRWAMRLFVVGLLLGGLGVLGKVFGRDPHGESRALVQCGSNMRQIGSAILLYSNEAQGRYPDRLEQLIVTQDISADVFVCPHTDDDASRGSTTRAVADGLAAGGHLSYVYVGAGLTAQCDPATVVLYESLANHAGEGMNVLFGDGHTEFMRPAEAREILDRLAAGERPVVWKGPGVRVWPATRGR